MKITDIRAEVINVSRYSNWVFVIAETDEGTQGFGEATLDGLEFEVVQAVKTLSKTLIGKDVVRDKLFVANRSGGMITAAAASGIDMAMWDLKGKAFNLPVYQMIGGAISTKVPVYVSFNRAIADRSPEGFGRRAKELVEQGNRALKCAPFDDVTWRDPRFNREAIDLGVRRFAAMREAVGDDIEIAVDLHWRLDLAMAQEISRRLLPYRPFWFEAPVPEHKPELISEIRKNCGMRIAGSEMQTGPEESIPLIQHHCLDVYMPDVRYMGGITGLMKLSSVIETFDCLLSPHNMSGPISTAASMHVAVGMRNLVNMEYHADEAEWIKDIADVHFEVKDGYFEVPEGPGLGVNLNLDVFREHPYQQAVPLRKNMLGG